MHHLRFLLVVLLLLAGAPFHQAVAFTSPASTTDACNQFDHLIEQRNIAEAQKVLQGAFQSAPKDYNVLFRMARLHVLLGDRETVEAKQEALYKQAVSYGDQAVAINPQGMGGYVYRAAANGKVALFKGIFSVADVVGKVRDDATKAISLNNEGTQRLAAAQYILGRTHLALAYKPKLVRLPLGLGWGSIDVAHAHLKKARSLRPGFIMFELEYARCLAEMDETAEALKIAKSVSAMKLQEPGDEQRKEDARQLVRDLE